MGKQVEGRGAAKGVGRGGRMERVNLFHDGWIFARDKGLCRRLILKSGFWLTGAAQSGIKGDQMCSSEAGGLSVRRWLSIIKVEFFSMEIAAK